MTKKKTEVEEVVEEVKEVETAEVVEEAPKKATKKSTKKKTEVVEEVKPEPEVKAIEEAKPEVKEEKSEGSYNVQVISPSGIYTYKKPGLDQQKGKVYIKGSKLTVTEVKGNWAKVGEDKWIILSGAVAKI